MIRPPSLLRKHICKRSQTELGCSLCGSGGFVARTLVLTDRGWRKVETLERGMRVQTLEHGLRRLVAVDQRTLWLDPVDCPDCVRPLRIPAGALSNNAEFTLPPDNCVVLRCDAMMGALGQRHALVHASDLSGFSGVARQTPPRKRRVFQLYFEAEEIVVIQGGAAVLCPHESDFLDLFPDPDAPGAHGRKSKIPRLDHAQADALILYLEEEMAQQGTANMPSVLDASWVAHA